MTDIGDYGVREIVVEGEHFALYQARDGRSADVLLKVAREGASPEDLSALSFDFVVAGSVDVEAETRRRHPSAACGNSS